MKFQLDRDGLELRPALLDQDELSLLEQRLGPSGRCAGSRIFGNVALEEWIGNGRVGAALRSILGPRSRPVRAILFDKNPATNWALGWHQDRAIAVRGAAPLVGFDHWTIKAGLVHVEPPFSMIEKMITVRIHLDAVDEANGPLLVSPGSHRFGRVIEEKLQGVIERCGIVECLAEAGDVWLYRAAILHASNRSRSNRSRRVLQIDFSADDLPDPLEWLGIS